MALRQFARASAPLFRLQSAAPLLSNSLSRNYSTGEEEEEEGGCFAFFFLRLPRWCIFCFFEYLSNIKGHSAIYMVPS